MHYGSCRSDWLQNELQQGALYMQSWTTLGRRMVSAGQKVPPGALPWQAVMVAGLRWLDRHGVNGG